MECSAIFSYTQGRERIGIECVFLSLSKSLRRLQRTLIYLTLQVEKRYTRNVPTENMFTKNDEKQIIHEGISLLSQVKLCVTFHLVVTFTQRTWKERGGKRGNKECEWLCSELF